MALVDGDAWPLTSSARSILQTHWPLLPYVVMLHGEHPALDPGARQLGATELLVKPFDLPDVVALVERLTDFPHAEAETRISQAF